MGPPVLILGRTLNHGGSQTGLDLSMKTKMAQKYMVFPNVFKKEVAKGLDYQYTLKILSEKGWSIQENRREDTQKKSESHESGHQTFMSSTLVFGKSDEYFI